MTELLYYQDQYQTDFQAQIQKKEKVGEKFNVTLNQTLFYPAGGGQPSDKGTINNVTVVNVIKDSQNNVIHTLDGDPGSSDLVCGKIDMGWRYDHMQQHTGQHLLSALFMKLYTIQTTAVHFGTDYSTIEFLSDSIDESMIEAIEYAASTIIAQALTVKAEWKEKDDAQMIHLRRPIQEKRITEKVRLITIEKWDIVACGGIHCNSTSEVQSVKCIGMEKIRGTQRLIWKIGKRAIIDYQKKDRIMSQLRQQLSTGNEEMIQTIKKIQEDMKEEKRQLKVYSNLLLKNYREIFHSIIAKKSNELISYIWDDFDGEFVKKLALDLIKNNPCTLCFVNKTRNKLNWLIATSRNGGIDFNRVNSDTLPIIDGKGGGRFPIWQGIGKNTQNIDQFFLKLSTML